MEVSHKEAVMNPAVTVSHEGNFATITLTNPAKRNALSMDVLRALTDAFTDVSTSDARGIILAADGPVFSAGHNFGEMNNTTRESAQELFDVCSHLMQLMHTIDQPVIARVHALATAAGCQLVATCDLAVAARSASFAIPGGKGGLFCHTPLVAVARNLTPKRALEMAMTGDPITADTALQWGFINEVVADEDLDTAVHDLLTRATRGSRESKALGKRAYYEQIQMTESEAYTFASAVMADAVVSWPAQEGIRAFLDKRHPEFGGR
jgi:enoyl-CoA hydratase/carnithine racemase